jgi:hypothetical protein
MFSKPLRVAVAALAACFVLVLSANAQVTQQELERLKPASNEVILPVPSGPVLEGKGLNAWLEGMGPGGQPGAIRGFGGAKKTEGQKFFALGSLYTALLIQVRSASTLEAAGGVDTFRQALAKLNAPEGFFSYLSELELMIKSQAAGPEVAGRLAGAMQGFLADFVRSRGDVAYVHYQAGRWVTSLALAAKAQDAGGLQLSAAAYFRERLSGKETSEGARAALAELQNLADKQTLTDAEYARIEMLAQQLRAELG